MDQAANSASSSTSDSKHKGRAQYGENGTSCNREQKPATSATPTSSSTWYETHGEHHKEHKKRKRSNDREWSGGSSSNSRERSSSSRVPRENQRGAEEESKEGTLKNEEHQPYQAYGGYAQDATTYGNRNAAMGMVPMVPSYGSMTTMNGWTMNHMDGNMGAQTSMSSGMEMGLNSGAGMNPYAFVMANGMTPDPSMVGVPMTVSNPYLSLLFGNDGSVGPMAPMGPVPQPRGPLQFSKCFLYPPDVRAPPPTTREKPAGCKTVFVGGLPENATEDVMREIFERCGEIATIRMSKKNFCHIRFASETLVDSAIQFSGYRIRIGDKDDAPNTGRLHVDYAQARDDQYEFECRQRSLQREARHRERQEQEYYHPPTPPPVAHYSDHEASALGEKLRGEETFQQAVFVLITWLERGECNKRNAGYFYSMIQSTNSHVRRLMNEKLKYEDELNKAKMMLKQQMQGILLQFNDIGKVFSASSLQKVWDHFTKAQRKNIELWKKQTEEIKNAHVEEVLNDRIEDEMEVSGDENEEDAAKKTENGANTPIHPFGLKSDSLVDIAKLKEEINIVQSQLVAAENELALVRLEAKQEKDAKDRQIQAYQKALQTYQPGMFLMQQRRENEQSNVKDLRPLKKRIRKDKDGECSHENDDNALCHQDSSEHEIGRDVFNYTGTSSGVNFFTITENEARLIGLISTFLNVHPFGASVDYICSYLHQIDSMIHARDVEALMKNFPAVFKEESTGIGASLEKKWTFCGFKSSS